jgi:hypothetical protein
LERERDTTIVWGGDRFSLKPCYDRSGTFYLRICRMTGGARTQLKKRACGATLPQRGIGFVVWDRLEKGGLWRWPGQDRGFGRKMTKVFAARYFSRRDSGVRVIFFVEQPPVMYCNPFCWASCWASHLTFFGILRHQDAHALPPPKAPEKLLGGKVSNCRNSFSSGGQTPFSPRQIKSLLVTRIDSGTTERCAVDRCTPQDPSET